MDNAKALHLSPALLKVVTEVNYAFYDLGVMLPLLQFGAL